MANIRAVYTGKISLKTVSLGTFSNIPNVAVASFQLLADLQAYPIFVRGIAAIALRRYAQIINEFGKDKELMVTVELDLLASGHFLMAFAAKIHWHVYGELRDQAESRISADKRHVFDGIGLPPDWPRAELLPPQPEKRG